MQLALDVGRAEEFKRYAAATVDIGVAKQGVKEQIQAIRMPWVAEQIAHMQHLADDLTDGIADKSVVLGAQGQEAEFSPGLRLETPGQVTAITHADEQGRVFLRGPQRIEAGIGLVHPLSPSATKVVGVPGSAQGMPPPVCGAPHGAAHQVGDLRGQIVGTAQHANVAHHAPRHLVAQALDHGFGLRVGKAVDQPALRQKPVTQ